MKSPRLLLILLVLALAGLSSSCGKKGPTRPQDTTAPTVTGVTPAQGATDWGVVPQVTVTFSEPILPASLTDASFTLRVEGGAPLEGYVSLDAAGTTATFTLTGMLQTVDPTNSLWDLVATVTTAITDLAGNAQAQDRVWSFTNGYQIGMFQDDLSSGVPGTDIAGSRPQFGGHAWMVGGVHAGGQLLFKSGGGVEDQGPNDGSTYASCVLRSPIELTSLLTGEYLEINVTMANVAATPGSNLFQSTRLDVITNHGVIRVGEIDTDGYWGGHYSEGPVVLKSDVSTNSGQAVRLRLTLLVNSVGVACRVDLFPVGSGGISLPAFYLPADTEISELQLVRNLDDEVLFKDLTISRALE